MLSYKVTDLQIKLIDWSPYDSKPVYSTIYPIDGNVLNRKNLLFLSTLHSIIEEEKTTGFPE